jgi:hypothetical protein
LLGLAGCDQRSEFRTGDAEVFRGEVFGSESDPTGGSFIRQGFASFTEAELTFDPERAARENADGELESPGILHTRYPCPRDSGDCEPGELIDGPFIEAPLEPVQNLAHDVLSQYDFPGGGRIRSYIFGSRFESASGDERMARSAMVFLSLMDNGRVELRVIAAGARVAGESSDRHPPLFGVFALERQRK